jgi:hypothetical protein
MSESSFYDWLRLFDVEDENSKKECPNCGHAAIHFQYVGDLRVRIGFLDIWCDSCIHGVHISRIRAPEHVSMISFEDGAEYKRTVPNFIRIEPS